MNGQSGARDMRRSAVPAGARTSVGISTPRQTIGEDAYRTPSSESALASTWEALSLCGRTSPFQRHLRTLESGGKGIAGRLPNSALLTSASNVIDTFDSDPGPSVHRGNYKAHRTEM